MTRNSSLLARFSGGLSLAVLAAAFSFGGPSALRAAEEEVLKPAVLELVVAPIMDAVEALEHRLTRLEASAGAWADSLMTRRVIVHEICLADESGAQTCVTKGQLDALIRDMARAEIGEPAETTTQAIISPAAEPVGESATETAAAQSEPAAVPASEPATNLAAETAVAVIPIESSLIPATEPGAASESEPNGSAVVEPAAIEVPAETVPVTPIALPPEHALGVQELEHTGTISPDAPSAPAAPLAQAPESDRAVTAEAPGDE
jgi:hypothetical protein